MTRMIHEILSFISWYFPKNLMIKIFCDGSMEVRYSQHPFWWGFCPWITWLSKQSTVPARRHALGVKCSPGFIGFKTDFFWDKMLRSYPLFEGSGTIKWPNASISLGKTELWRWCNFIRPYLSVATWIQSPVVSVVFSCAICCYLLHSSFSSLKEILFSTDADGRSHSAGKLRLGHGKGIWELDTNSHNWSLWVWKSTTIK